MTTSQGKNVFCRVRPDEMAWLEAQRGPTAKTRSDVLRALIRQAQAADRAAKGLPPLPDPAPARRRNRQEEGPTEPQVLDLAGRAGLQAVIADCHRIERAQARGLPAVCLGLERLQAAAAQLRIYQQTPGQILAAAMALQAAQPPISEPGPEPLSQGDWR
jgi:hypothetical protein